MTKLLHIDSGILGDNSVSRKLSAAAVARLRQSHPDLEVRYRDLTAHPLPHLTGGYLAAMASPEQHGPELQHDLALGAEVLDEFMAADIVVIGAPMYNFTIASQLKAWIDRLLIAGKTFRYTETGVQGMAGPKRVIVASSRGGFYSQGGPQAAADFQEPYLRAVFGFIGIPDIEYVRAEGIALGPEQREKGIENGLGEVAKLAA